MIKPQKKRRRRTKVSDIDIVKLNNIGFSLSTIADLLDIHPTTVSNRLKANNVEPTNSRQAFMEDIIAQLTLDQQLWLQSKISGAYNIKHLVKDLLIQKFLEDTKLRDEDI